MTSAAVQRLESTPPPGAPIGIRTSMPMSIHGVRATRTSLRVESLGHLVPRTAFVGRVHSVFANACNLAVDATLLTVCTAAGTHGPVTLLLARDARGDLRDRFAVGERIASRGGRLRSDRVELDLTHARLWRPAAPRRILPRARIEAHLRRARAHLAQRRIDQRSVLDGDAAPAAAALAAACRILDLEQAVRHADRLVGWGEGLTPAGDDFLVGVLAGLAALACADARRRRFHDTLSQAIASRATRTTAIAAHFLRLAAGGHWTEPLESLRDALLCEDADHAVSAALQRTLAVGASSGADTASGLLAAIEAWLPGHCAREPT